VICRQQHAVTMLSVGLLQTLSHCYHLSRSCPSLFDRRVSVGRCTAR